MCRVSSNISLVSQRNVFDSQADTENVSEDGGDDMGDDNGDVTGEQLTQLQMTVEDDSDESVSLLTPRPAERLARTDPRETLVRSSSSATTSSMTVTPPGPSLRQEREKARKKNIGRGNCGAKENLLFLSFYAEKYYYALHGKPSTLRVAAEQHLMIF
jgi:hypothetical protein